MHTMESFLSARRSIGRHRGRPVWVLPVSLRATGPALPIVTPLLLILTSFLTQPSPLILRAREPTVTKTPQRSREEISTLEEEVLWT
jgi:hypothetical protein